MRKRTVSRGGARARRAWAVTGDRRHDGGQQGRVFYGLGQSRPPDRSSPAVTPAEVSMIRRVLGEPRRRF